jgi:hypothetical protein
MIGGGDEINAKQGRKNTSPPFDVYHQHACVTVT